MKGFWFCCFFFFEVQEAAKLAEVCGVWWSGRVSQSVRRLTGICWVRTGSSAVPALRGRDSAPRICGSSDLILNGSCVKPGGRCTRRSPRLCSTSRSDAANFSCHTLPRCRLVGKNTYIQAGLSTLFCMNPTTTTAMHFYAKVTVSKQTSSLIFNTDQPC